MSLLSSDQLMREPLRGEISGVISHEILDRDPVPATRLNPDLPPKLEDIINDVSLRASRSGQNGNRRARFGDIRGGTKRERPALSGPVRNAGPSVNRFKPDAYAPARAALTRVSGCNVSAIRPKYIR